MSNKYEVEFLIGVPCSGKSHYRRNSFSDEQVFIISRDDIREQLIEEYGIGYQNLYTKPKEGDPKEHPVFGVQTENGEWSKIVEMNQELKDRFEQQKINSLKALYEGKKVIVDLTNLTKQERSDLIQIFKKFGAHDITATVFKFDGNEEYIFKMNQIRGEQTNNVIPDFIIQGMMDKYEAPSLSEGFSEIKLVDTYADFKPSEKLKSQMKTGKNPVGENVSLESAQKRLQRRKDRLS